MALNGPGNLNVFFIACIISCNKLLYIYCYICINSFPLKKIVIVINKIYILIK